jgi:hypothetical protein
MPSLKPTLKPILFVVSIALALGAASQPPVSAQVFKSRMDLGQKDCEGKHGKFENGGLSSDKYTCTRASEHKVDHCVASTGKCTTTDMPAAKATPAAAAPAAPAKSLAGTGDVSKAGLKDICAKNSAWQFTVERSGGYSCMDVAAGIAINCKKERDCTESHVPVRAR